MYTSQDIFVVTGATSGIGKGVVFSLLKYGASVVAVGRNVEKLNLLKDETNNEKNLFLEEKDLSSCDGLDKWILNISKKYGKLKGLVLSAGIQQTTPISSVLSVEKSKELFEINYFSNIQLAKGFCDRRANVGKGSSIVFLSSIASSNLFITTAPTASPTPVPSAASSKVRVRSSLDSIPKLTSTFSGYIRICAPPTKARSHSPHEIELIA